MATSSSVRWWLAASAGFAWAACGTPAKPAPLRTERVVAIADAGAATSLAAAMAPVVHQGKPRRPVEAPHAGAIVELAMTSDGTAAVTSDELGGIRLWPKLDGSLEPRVVELARPRVLALGKRGDRFVIAGIDDVGGLEVAIVDAGGVTLQRATQFADLAYGDVVMMPRGPLATRSDQAIVQLDDSGAITGALAAEPGQRLVGIALAGDRPYALLEKHALEPQPDVDAGTGPAPAVPQLARWIESGAAGLSWGAWIDAGIPLGSSVAISPGGKRLAAIVTDLSRRSQVIVVDLATKKPLLAQAAGAALHLAFADEDHVAMGGNATVIWLDVAKATPPTNLAVNLSPVVTRNAAHLASAAGIAIGTHNGELVISAPDQTRYLGYQLEAPHVVAVAPHGGLMVGVGETFSLLDRELHEIGQPAGLVAKGASVAQLRWLAGDDWLVESAQPDGTALALVDLARGTSQVARTRMPVVYTLAYEPSTRLVTLSYGETPEIDRYDPEHHRLDKVVAMPPPAKAFEQRQLVPTSPALANGVQIVSVQLRDKLAMRWLRDPAQPDRGDRLEAEGSLAGVDSAGRVLVWQNRPGIGLRLVMFQDGKEAGAIAMEGSAMVWPDPRAAQLVQLGQRAVSLIGLDGVTRWALGIEGTTEVLWLDDGAIALVGTGGIARVDAATGAVTAARCGWRFGLTTRPHPVTARVEPVCTQLMTR